MADARFVSKSAGFFAKNAAFKNFFQGHMMLDIERMIKDGAGTPVKQGLMKASIRTIRTDNGKWRVESPKVYSAYQELGARTDGSHKVSNYTTSGTSAGWFRRAIMSIVKNKDSYVSEARRAVGL